MENEKQTPTCQPQACAGSCTAEQKCPEQKALEQRQVTAQAEAAKIREAYKDAVNGTDSR